MAVSRTTSFAATNSASDCTTSTLATEVHQRRSNDLQNLSRSGATADEIRRRDIIDSTQANGGGSLEPPSGQGVRPRISICQENEASKTLDPHEDEEQLSDDVRKSSVESGR
jgi:hypothetical protein